MTREQYLRAFQMRLDGASYRTIAKELGMDSHSVKDRLGAVVSTNDYAPFGRKAVEYPAIQDILRQFDFKTSHIARECGMSQSTVTRVFLGPGMVTRKTMDKFLSAFGLTEEELYAD